MDRRIVRAFLQCFAHSSPGPPLVFGAEMRRVSSTYYNHYNNYRTTLDNSLGQIIGVRGTKRGKCLREHQRDRVLLVMFGAGSVVLALALLTI